MKISVVTISFNQGIYLKEAIESVISQSHKNIEYIIIDAGSKDNSRETINSYKEHFRHIVFEPDKGPADGLNKGLALCTGDLFCYLNADDRFVPGAFEHVANLFSRKEEIDGVIGSAYVIDKAGVRRKRRYLSKAFTVKTILNETALALQQATFLRLPFIKAKSIFFNVENTTAWDAEFLIDFCIKGGVISTIDKTLGEFRIYPESITGSQRLNDKHEENKRRLYERLDKMGFVINAEKENPIRLSKFNLLRLVKSYLK